MNQTEALRLALALALKGKAYAEECSHMATQADVDEFDTVATAIKEALAQPEQEPVAKKMTAHRAAYFMERFKHEEKLLGPNEQAALDFVISMLEAQPEQEPVGFVVDRYNGANTPSLPPTAMVAWLNDNPKIGQVLYTTPPQRKPLTTDELVKIAHETTSEDLPAYKVYKFGRAIEAAHGVKGDA